MAELRSWGRGEGGQPRGPQPAGVRTRAGRSPAQSHGGPDACLPASRRLSVPEGDPSSSLSAPGKRTAPRALRPVRWPTRRPQPRRGGDVPARPCARRQERRRLLPGEAGADPAVQGWEAGRGGPRGSRAVLSLPGHTHPSRRRAPCTRLRGLALSPQELPVGGGGSRNEQWPRRVPTTARGSGQGCGGREGA